MKRKTLFFIWVISLLISATSLSTFGEEENIKVKGKVTDVDNKPVIGANVYLYKYGIYEEVPTPIDETITQNDGTFTFKQVVKSNQEQLSVLAMKEGLAVGGLSIYREVDSEKLHIFLQLPETISGEITDKSGRPIAEAIVTCHLQTIDPEEKYSYISSDKDNRRLVAITDEEGKFVLKNLPKNSELALIIEAEGYARLNIYDEREHFKIKAGTQNLFYTLIPEGKIEGEVVDKESGKKIKGITLYCCHQEDRYAKSPTESDENGNFQFKGLKAGKHTIFVDFSKESMNYIALAKENVEVVEGGCLKGIKIELVKGEYVTGKVTDEKSGKPIKDARLAFFGPMCPSGYYPNPSTTSKEDGTYKFMLPPGENTVVCYGAEGYQYPRENRVRKVNVVVGKTISNIDFTLTPNLKIKGVVVDEKENPIAGAEVELINYPYPGKQKTDKDGKFTIPIQFYPHESSKCLIASDEKNEKVGMVEVGAGYDESKKVKVVLFPSAVIKGRAVNREGKGISGVNISAFLLVGNMGLPCGRDKVKVDSEGNFEVAGLAGNNKYNVAVSATGYGQETKNDVFLSNGQIYNLGEIVLKVANAFVAGRITDEEGEPVGGLEIYIYGEGQKGRNTKSNEDGTFRIGELVEGKVSINAWEQETQSHGEVRDVETGRSDVEIVLYSQSPRKPKEITGKQAPSLAIEKCLGIKPEDIKFGDGKVIVMISFSIYSPPAKMLLSHINKLIEEYKNKDILFIGLHDDSAIPSEIEKLVDSGTIKFPVVFSKPKRRNVFGLQIYSDLGIITIPQIIIVDQKGIVRFNNVKLEDISSKIDSLIQ